MTATLDETTRALVHLATGNDAVLWPSVPLGAAVSIMGAAEAATFVGAVELLATGRLEAVCVDGEPMRLREVA